MNLGGILSRCSNLMEAAAVPSKYVKKELF